VVNVTHCSNIYVRLIALELLLCHCRGLTFSLVTDSRESVGLVSVLPDYGLDHFSGFPEFLTRL